MLACCSRPQTSFAPGVVALCGAGASHLAAAAKRMDPELVLHHPQTVAGVLSSVEASHHLAKAGKPALVVVPGAISAPVLPCKTALYCPPLKTLLRFSKNATDSRSLLVNFGIHVGPTGNGTPVCSMSRADLQNVLPLRNEDGRTETELVHQFLLHSLELPATRSIGLYPRHAYTQVLTGSTENAVLKLRLLFQDQRQVTNLHSKLLGPVLCGKCQRTPGLVQCGACLELLQSALRGSSFESTVSTVNFAGVVLYGTDVGRGEGWAHTYWPFAGQQQLMINASGTDLHGISDNLHFECAEIDNDFEFGIKLRDIFSENPSLPIHPRAFCGIMVRGNTADDSPFIAVVQTALGNVRIVTRGEKGSTSTAFTLLEKASGRIQLRLVRETKAFIIVVKQGEVERSSTIILEHFSSTCLVGIALSSADVDIKASAIVDDLEIRANPKVDGGWTEWKFEPCTPDCTRKGTRTCTAPSPSHGGKDCEGAAVAQEQCNIHACAEDLKWGPWSECNCSAPCGGGTCTQTRACLSSSKPCVGASSRTIPCNETPCPVPTPMPTPSASEHP
eukprot:TRINITY_DN6278_c0_g1_i1.p1 TRINITY_DN6278_c0_g1~~TRINITY_DN6278_c0_g1_i1.p1  ORF type:complete len:561 (-),score=36.70 TRINITY_DN6278_c0_g1_i1:36-1718(-)